MNETNLLLVTVIVPCYNHEMYVEVCLDSIFRQTYKNVEVIVVDDFSSDNSVEVIKQLQKKYDFKFIEHKENWGLTKTLNDVIYNHANGKYIKPLASDDYLSDDCVEVLVYEIEQAGESFAVVYGKTQKFYTNLATNEKIYAGIFGSKTSPFDLLFEQSTVPAASTMFRKSVIIEVNGYPEASYIEDLYMLLRVTQKYDILFVDKIISHYRVNNSQSLSSNYPKMLASLTSILANQFVRNNDITYETVYKLYVRFETEYLYFIVSYLNMSLKINKRKALSLYKENLLFLIKKMQFKFLCTFWIKILIV